MHQPRRRGRRASRRGTAEPARHALYQLPFEGADVVLVGFFSGKQKDYETVMAEAAARLAADGGRVVARIVQRRGVSDGGVRKMSLPFSSRTLLRQGKVREVAHAADRTDADVVVFTNSLTEHQRLSLTALLGRPAVGLADLLGSG